MPQFYRAMTRDGNKPKVGPTARTLGVRPDVDITAEADDNVLPHTGGMSVAPSWRQLPPWRIPRRLDSIVADACGKNEDACWKFGDDGSFEQSLLNEHLLFRPDASDHGIVEPSAIMKLEEFQAALAATSDQWEIDER